MFDRVAQEDAEYEEWAATHKHVLTYEKAITTENGEYLGPVYFCDCGHEIPEDDWPGMSRQYTIKEK